jgi:DNA-binding transcriptional LysR family regulator
MHFDHLSGLSVFDAVARHGSFRKAAAALSLSTSAVSSAVRTLEERLGIGLFNRTTRSVALTEAGRHLLERLRPSLQGVGAALDELNAFRLSPAGTLRIHSSLHAATAVLAPLLRRFMAAYPAINLEVVSDDANTDIVADGFDLGIAFKGEVPEDMVAVTTGPPQRLVVVGAPDYFARHGVPRHPDELQQHECVRYRSGALLHKWSLAKDGVSLRIDVPGRLSVGEPDLAVSAALHGAALAMIPEQLAAPLLADGRLRRALAEWCPPTSALALYYPRQRRMSFALRAFIDMARAA